MAWIIAAPLYGPKPGIIEDKEHGALYPISRLLRPLQSVSTQ